jgi:hypothetical protein
MFYLIYFGLFWFILVYYISLFSSEGFVGAEISVVDAGS